MKIIPFPLSHSSAKKYNRLDYSDHEILDGIIRNENDVIKHIYKKYFTKIKQMVFTFKHTGLYPEDIFQEGLTSAVINIREGKFRGESSFYTYLNSICRNICLKELSQMKGRNDELKEEVLDENETELIREEKSQKRNRMFVWFIAASFLILVSISGIVLFTGQSAKQSNMANNSNGVETLLIPQIKQAEEKATIHIMGHVKLLAPIKNKLCDRADSIAFRWETDAEAETYIIIGSQKDGNTIYREKIKMLNKHFVLDKNFLPRGQYTWAIEGFSAKEKFGVFDK